jgi:hypothetical protein
MASTKSVAEGTADLRGCGGSRLNPCDDQQRPRKSPIISAISLAERGIVKAGAHEFQSLADFYAAISPTLCPITGVGGSCPHIEPA